MEYNFSTMIKDILRKKNLTFEIIRFILGGCTTAVVTFGSYWLMTDSLNIPPTLSVILSTLLAWCYSFVINKILVFLNHSAKELKRQGILFFLQQIVLLLLSCSAMYLGHDILGINDKIIIVIWAVVSAVLNFIGLKLFVYRISERSHK